MILPFSTSRSSTSLTSNCLYCASLTPRAMFSKSMNIANFRSPSMDLYYRGMRRPDPSVAHRVPPGQVLTDKWPVLTYGRTPGLDKKRWTFRCFGLVDRETTWTWDEFLQL